MADRLQRFFLLLVVALLVGGTGLALRFARRYQPVAGLTPAVSGRLPTDIGLRFEKVQVVGRAEGAPAWTIEAPQVDTNHARNRLDFTGGIRAALQQRDAPRAHLRAPDASFDVTGKRLTAAGGVEARLKPTTPGEQEAIVQTQLVLWDVGAATLHCPQDVIVEIGAIHLEGRRLEANLKTQALTLQGARGHAPLEEGGLR